jgi:hypothetical protein
MAAHWMAAHWMAAHWMAAIMAANRCSGNSRRSGADSEPSGSACLDSERGLNLHRQNTTGGRRTQKAGAEHERRGSDDPKE